MAVIHRKGFDVTPLTLTSRLLLCIQVDKQLQIH